MDGNQAPEMHWLLRSGSVALKHTCSRFSRLSFYPPSLSPSVSPSLPVSLNILSAWRQAAVTGQRLVTRWRVMRAVSSGLAGPDGLVGRCARKCKIQLDTTRLSITATFYRQRSGRRGCVFSPLYVCMYVCALVFVLFFLLRARWYILLKRSLLDI